MASFSMVSSSASSNWLNNNKWTAITNHGNDATNQYTFRPNSWAWHRFQWLQQGLAMASCSHVHTTKLINNVQISTKQTSMPWSLKWTQLWNNNIIIISYQQDKQNRGNFWAWVQGSNTTVGSNSMVHVIDIEVIPTIHNWHGNW